MKSIRAIFRRGGQTKIDQQQTPETLSRASSANSLNADQKAKGGALAKIKKNVSREKIDKVGAVPERRIAVNEKKVTRNNNQIVSDEEVCSKESLMQDLQEMAEEKNRLALQLGEKTNQLTSLKNEITKLKIFQEQSSAQLEKLNEENTALRNRLRDVAHSPLSDNEKQELLQRHHNSAPASIATTLLDDGHCGDITACPTPDWDKYSSSNVSEVSVACLQDKINQMQETHYSTNEELQATLQELTDLQKQLVELQQDNERLLEEKNLMFDSLCRQTERLNETRAEVESLKQLLYRNDKDDGQLESAVEREQKLLEVLKSAHEEREDLLVKQDEMGNELSELRSVHVEREAELGRLMERVRTLESTLDAKHAEHRQLDRELALAKDQSSGKQIEIDRLSDLLENARTKIIELEQDRALSDKSELDELLDNARKEKDSLESEVAHLKEQLARSRNEGEKLREQVLVLQEECKVTRNNAKCTQSELEYKCEKLQSEKAALTEQMQQIQEAVNEMQVQTQCQLEEKRQLSSVLSETQRSLSDAERRIVELENESSELKRLRAEENEEWERFQNDLLTSVRVANDFKTEAQQNVQRLIMENKAERDRIRMLEAQLDKLKGPAVATPPTSEKKKRHFLFGKSRTRASNTSLSSSASANDVRFQSSDDIRYASTDSVAEKCNEKLGKLSGSLEKLKLIAFRGVGKRSSKKNGEERRHSQQNFDSERRRRERRIEKGLEEIFEQIDFDKPVEEMSEKEKALVRLKECYQKELKQKKRRPRASRRKEFLAVSKPLLGSVILNPKLREIASDPNIIEIDPDVFENSQHFCRDSCALRETASLDDFALMSDDCEMEANNLIKSKSLDGIWFRTEAKVLDSYRKSVRSLDCFEPFTLQESSSESKMKTNENRASEPLTVTTNLSSASGSRQHETTQERDTSRIHQEDIAIGSNIEEEDAAKIEELFSKIDPNATEDDLTPEELFIVKLKKSMDSLKGKTLRKFDKRKKLKISKPTEDSILRNQRLVEIIHDPNYLDVDKLPRGFKGTVARRTDDEWYGLNISDEDFQEVLLDDEERNEPVTPNIDVPRFSAPGFRDPLGNFAQNVSGITPRIGYIFDEMGEEAEVLDQMGETSQVSLDFPVATSSRDVGGLLATDMVFSLEEEEELEFDRFRRRRYSGLSDYSSSDDELQQFKKKVIPVEVFNKPLAAISGIEESNVLKKEDRILEDQSENNLTADIFECAQESYLQDVIEETAELTVEDVVAASFKEEISMCNKDDQDTDCKTEDTVNLIENIQLVCEEMIRKEIECAQLNNLPKYGVNEEINEDAELRTVNDENEPVSAVQEEDASNRISTLSSHLRSYIESMYCSEEDQQKVSLENKRSFDAVIKELKHTSAFAKFIESPDQQLFENQTKSDSSKEIRQEVQNISFNDDDFTIRKNQWQLELANDPEIQKLLENFTSTDETHRINDLTDFDENYADEKPSLDKLLVNDLDENEIELINAVRREEVSSPLSQEDVDFIERITRQYSEDTEKDHIYENVRFSTENEDGSIVLQRMISSEGIRRPVPLPRRKKLQEKDDSTRDIDNKEEIYPTERLSGDRYDDVKIKEITHLHVETEDGRIVLAKKVKVDISNDSEDCTEIQYSEFRAHPKDEINDSVKEGNLKSAESVAAKDSINYDTKILNVEPLVFQSFAVNNKDLCEQGLEKNTFIVETDRNDKEHIEDTIKYTAETNLAEIKECVDNEANLEEEEECNCSISKNYDEVGKIIEVPEANKDIEKPKEMIEILEAEFSEANQDTEKSKEIIEIFEAEFSDANKDIEKSKEIIEIFEAEFSEANQDIEKSKEMIQILEAEFSEANQDTEKSKEVIEIFEAAFKEPPKASQHVEIPTPPLRKNKFNVNASKDNELPCFTVEPEENDYSLSNQDCPQTFEAAPVSVIEVVPKASNCDENVPTDFPVTDDSSNDLQSQIVVEDVQIKIAEVLAYANQLPTTSVITYEDKEEEIRSPSYKDNTSKEYMNNHNFENISNSSKQSDDPEKENISNDAKTSSVQIIHPNVPTEAPNIPYNPIEDDHQTKDVEKKESTVVVKQRLSWQLIAEKLLTEQFLENERIHSPITVTPASSSSISQVDKYCTQRHPKEPFERAIIPPDNHRDTCNGLEMEQADCFRCSNCQLLPRRKDVSNYYKSNAAEDPSLKIFQDVFNEEVAKYSAYGVTSDDLLKYVPSRIFDAEKTVKEIEDPESTDKFYDSYEEFEDWKSLDSIPAGTKSTVRRKSADFNRASYLPYMLGIKSEQMPPMRSPKLKSYNPTATPFTAAAPHPQPKATLIPPTYAAPSFSSSPITAPSYTLPLLASSSFITTPPPMITTTTPYVTTTTPYSTSTTIPTYTITPHIDPVMPYPSKEIVADIPPQRSKARHNLTSSSSKAVLTESVPQHLHQSHTFPKSAASKAVLTEATKEPEQSKMSPPCHYANLTPTSTYPPKPEIHAQNQSPAFILTPAYPFPNTDSSRAILTQTKQLKTSTTSSQSPASVGVLAEINQTPDSSIARTQTNPTPKTISEGVLVDTTPPKAPPIETQTVTTTGTSYTSLAGSSCYVSVSNVSPSIRSPLPTPEKKASIQLQPEPSPTSTPKKQHISSETTRKTFDNAKRLFENLSGGNLAPYEFKSETLKEAIRQQLSKVKEPIDTTGSSRRRRN